VDATRGRVGKIEHVNNYIGTAEKLKANSVKARRELDRKVDVQCLTSIWLVEPRKIESWTRIQLQRFNG
jgi:hypothetical protein